MELVHNKFMDDAFSAEDGVDGAPDNDQDDNVERKRTLPPQPIQVAETPIQYKMIAEKRFTNT